MYIYLLYLSLLMLMTRSFCTECQQCNGTSCLMRLNKRKLIHYFYWYLLFLHECTFSVTCRGSVLICDSRLGCLSLCRDQGEGVGGRPCVASPNPGRAVGNPIDCTVWARTPGTFHKTAKPRLNSENKN